jgi:hypothetical protein
LISLSSSLERLIETPELIKVRRSVDRRVMIRRLQGAMGICVMMEQLSHATQGGFHRLVWRGPLQRKTTLIAAANCLLIRWFSSCSSTPSSPNNNRLSYFAPSAKAPQRGLSPLPVGTPDGRLPTRLLIHPAVVRAPRPSYSRPSAARSKVKTPS